MVVAVRQAPPVLAPTRIDNAIDRVSLVIYRLIPLLVAGLMLNEANNLVQDRSYLPWFDGNKRFIAIMVCGLGGFVLASAAIFYNCYQLHERCCVCAEPHQV